MLILNHNYFNVTPPNKCKDNVQISKRRYVFGIFLLFLVNVLWVVSAELTKYIYSEVKLERPFLITYLRSSLLIVYLIVLCFTPPTRDPNQPADYTQLLEPSSEAEEDNFYNEANNSLGDSIFVPVRAAGETTDSDDAAPKAVRFNKVAEVRVMSASQAGEALLARLSWAASVRATEHAQRLAAAAATRRHLRLALAFTLPWFLSNYLYRLSLLHTTTSIATIYLVTGSAMAISFGALFAQMPADRFNFVKTISVLLTASGLVMIGTVNNNNWTAILSALGAALCYALHLVAMRRELRKAEGVNAPLLAGLVGCACGGLSWPLGVALNALNAEQSELPPPPLWSWLLIDSALGPLLFEALWLWGYSLTSPQVATTTLSLIIPLQVVIDAWHGRGTYAQLIASTLVVAGWMFASAANLETSGAVNWMKMKLQAKQEFSTLRNIPELDEQSEALISSEEPT